MPPVAPLLLVLLGVSGGIAPARAGDSIIHGEYDTPLGRVVIGPAGAEVVGRLLAPTGPCRFLPGEEVLRGTVLDDSLAGRLRVCLAGRACRTREAWGNAVLLVAADRLSGAVHVDTKGCRASVGGKGGVVFRRAAAARASATRGAGMAPATRGPNARREKARRVLRDGAAWLSEGNFEKARARFLEAAEIDPALPEAFNGVGVTYRMRNDLAAALGWYKRALAIDPDFGDAYYNMACVYALRGEKALALRYLQIAALNGYATSEGIDGDPDLEPLRREPAYRALVRAEP
jgi:hypothetical protein